MSLRIAILHNHVAEGASASDRDVLVQVAEVEKACRELGHTTWRLDCTLNLHAVHVALAEDRPDVVFNLVESLAGSDRLASFVPALLEALRIPFTGSSSQAMELSNCKPSAKAKLRSLGLPTPDWIAPGQAAWPSQAEFQPPYIIKAIWEHASLGIDDGSIITSDERGDVLDRIAQRTESLGCPCFAETFIEGREFNLSLIDGPESLEVLPPAEIDFGSFPADKPRIVGYAAKWDEQSLEFQQTPRRFDFDERDLKMLDEMRLLARRAWNGLRLDGYARVDFRVDGAGKPWILEVNTNPCLSPDAGFAAAIARAGSTFTQAVERILNAALGTSETREDTGKLTHPARQERAQLAHQVTLRSEANPADCEALRNIVERTTLFRPGEVDVAVELVEDRLATGANSEYQFVFADLGAELLGYICFGYNEMTVSSYEVYWIAVDPSQHGRGLGRLLLEQAERTISAAGGKRVYIETSNRVDYASTRGFYLRCGYQIEAILRDYYAPDDDKVVYVKEL